MASPKFIDPSKKVNMPAVGPASRGVGKATPLPKVTKKGIPSGTNMSRMSADDKTRQTSAFKSAIGYLGTVAREVRDVPTAVGTGLVAAFDRSQGGQPNSSYKQKIVDNDTRADWNTRRQIKEAVKSIAGKKGTRSDQIQGGNYVNNTPKKKVVKK
jgi:hypothetical protein